MWDSCVMVVGLLCNVIELEFFIVMIEEVEFVEVLFCLLVVLLLLIRFCNVVVIFFVLVFFSVIMWVEVLLVLI